MLFIILGDQNRLSNIVLLNLMFLVAIITYFTSVTTGLAISICLDFIFLSINLYQAISKGISISSYIYFWATMLPLFTVAVGIFSSRSLRLQKENTKLKSQVNELVTIDEETGLRNKKGFVEDAIGYMNIASRYNHGLVLLVIGIKHQRDMELIAGKERVEQLVADISELLKDCMRKEDLSYLIDRKEVLWGLLLMTNDVVATEIVAERIREKMNQIQMQENKRMQGIDIQLCIGQANYSEAIKTPIDFLTQARKQMQYDV